MTQSLNGSMEYENDEQLLTIYYLLSTNYLK